MTTAKLTDAYKIVNFHFSDDSKSVLARNILLVHIILSDDFDPENLNDIKYLWDVWYSLQWNNVTKKRFIKDVQQVLAGQWVNSLISIPDPNGVQQLNDILRFWLDTATNIILEETHLEAILASR